MKTLVCSQYPFMMVGSFTKVGMIFLLFTGEIILATPVDKWHIVNDVGKIFIETELKYNWFEAWQECSSRNMTLIAVDTAEKSAALNQLLRKQFAKCPNLWIGGNDIGEEGKFIWFSTGKRFEFSNWKQGNPDNYQNKENCVHYWDVTDFEWNDVPCSSKLGFICEENRFLLAARRDVAVKKDFIDRLFEL